MYEVRLEHRPGKHYANADADALSRKPCKQCDFEGDWEKKSTPVVSQFKDIEFDEMSLRSLQEKDRTLQVVKTWVPKS